jgi:Arc/MetJ-type ribon-helix-helix transcriptional regulator
VTRFYAERRFSVTIQLPEELVRFVAEMVDTGKYASDGEVIRDALFRLKQTVEFTAATTDRTGGPALEDKPLTKQTLQRHLVQIGLVDPAPGTGSDPDDSDALSTEDEEDIISERVIRERLINWLIQFLPSDRS